MSTSELHTPLVDGDEVDSNIDDSAQFDLTMHSAMYRHDISCQGALGVASGTRDATSFVNRVRIHFINMFVNMIATG